jgi:hypothetical protein
VGARTGLFLVFHADGDDLSGCISQGSYFWEQHSTIHQIRVLYINIVRSRDSSFGVATCYGLEVPGIESRWGDEIFRTYPDRPWGPPSLPYNGYRIFPGVKSGRGVTLTTHLLLVPRSRKSRAIPLLPLWVLVACYRVKIYLTLH